MKTQASRQSELSSRVNRRDFMTAAAATAGFAALGWPSTTYGAETDYYAGAATADITPPGHLFPEYWLAGYAGAVPRRVDAGHQGRVFARALALQYGGKGPLRVMVSADVLGFTRRMHWQIVTWFARRFDVKQDALLLAATHTHSGPVLTDNLDPYVSYNMHAGQLATVDRYTIWLERRIAKLIEEAVLNMTGPVDLAYGTGRSAFGENRATGLNDDPLGTVDPDVPVLTARLRGSQRLLAVVFTYACHPQYALSVPDYFPDWPGEAAAMLEAAHPGSTALFINGCAGNINANYDVSGGPGPVLAGAVQEVIGGSGMRPVSGPLVTSYTEASLPLDLDQTDSFGDLITTERLRAIYQDIRFHDVGMEGYFRRHARQMVRAIDLGKLPRAVPLPVQLWRFGADDPLRLLALGGEVLAHYALFFKSEFKGLWVASYANEVPSYVPGDGALAIPSTCMCPVGTGFTGSYEAGWGSTTSRFDPATGADVTSAVADGSMLFYGWPCRYRAGDEGVEARVKRAGGFLLRST
jgi:neutral/alkaline ceramidase-like enzyme